MKSCTSEIGIALFSKRRLIQFSVPPMKNFCGVGQ
jgi:hypothetical protein